MTGAPEYLLSRWLFLRLLALVYLLAFASLAPQVLGLVGPAGILPADQFLERAREFYGADAYRQLPTLLWFSASEGALLALSWGGVVVSLLALAGIAPTLLFVLLWVAYLSLTIAGQTFLSFQWDVLLLEAGLLGASTPRSGGGHDYQADHRRRLSCSGPYGSLRSRWRFSPGSRNS